MCVHLLDGALKLHPLCPGFVHFHEVAEQVYGGLAAGTGFGPPIPTKFVATVPLAEVSAQPPSGWPGRGGWPGTHSFSTKTVELLQAWRNRLAVMRMIAGNQICLGERLRPGIMMSSWWCVWAHCGVGSRWGVARRRGSFGSSGSELSAIAWATRLAIGASLVNS